MQLGLDIVSLPERIDSSCGLGNLLCPKLGWMAYLLRNSAISATVDLFRSVSHQHCLLEKLRLIWWLMCLRYLGGRSTCTLENETEEGN